MRLSSGFLAIGFAVTLARASVATAAPIQLVANGGFETGDFTGWTISDQAGGSGSFFINAQGAVSPFSGFATVANAAGGAFYAITDQGGPGTHVITQTIVVPASSSVLLSVDYFVNDWSDLGPLGDQLDYTVVPTQFSTGDVLTAGAGPFDTGAGVLFNIGQGVGDNLVPKPHDWATLVFDLTALLGGGGTFQLRFAEADNQLFLNLGIDNVSVLADPVPEPASLLLLGSGVAGLVARRYRRRSS
jgi:hypothetical protein